MADFFYKNVRGSLVWDPFKIITQVLYLSSTGEVKLVGVGDQWFLDNNKTLVLKEREEGGQNVNISVTSFMDDPLLNSKLDIPARCTFDSRKILL